MLSTSTKKMKLFLLFLHLIFCLNAKFFLISMSVSSCAYAIFEIFFSPYTQLLWHRGGYWSVNRSNCLWDEAICGCLENFIKNSHRIAIKHVNTRLTRQHDDEEIFLNASRNMINYSSSFHIMWKSFSIIPNWAHMWMWWKLIQEREILLRK
jgi:hypothetical protein